MQLLIHAGIEVKPCWQKSQNHFSTSVLSLFVVQATHANVKYSAILVIFPLFPLGCKGAVKDNCFSHWSYDQAEFGALEVSKIFSLITCCLASRAFWLQFGLKGPQIQPAFYQGYAIWCNGNSHWKKRIDDSENKTDIFSLVVTALKTSQISLFLHISTRVLGHLWYHRQKI